MKGHARQIMTERPTAVGPDATLESIARILVAGRFGGVPVVNAQDRVLGFVSEAEVVAALLRDASPHTLARNMMTQPVLVDEFDTTDDVMRVMREAHTDHVLVIREGRLVGIIAPLDVLRHFVERVMPPPLEVG
jgi:CBS domain-containing protein